MRQDVLIHMDGQYADEGFPAGDASVVDLRALEGTHCYLDPEIAPTVRARLGGYPLGGVHWIGSGDYHYLSALWAERIDIPFSLVVFDHHPDCQAPAFGRILSCGGWVRDLLLEHPFLDKVLLVGIDRSLEEEAAMTAREAGEQRLGWTCADELALRPLPDVAGRFGLQGPLYLSIDKDVLTKEHAVTHWSQGQMTLEMLTEDLRYLCDRFELLGADVCGGVSLASGASENELRRNLASDLAISEALRF